MTREQTIEVLTEVARLSIVDETGVAHPEDIANQMSAAIISAAITLSVLTKKGLLK